jgi:hypothetical protein
LELPASAGNGEALTPTEGVSRRLPSTEGGYRRPQRSRRHVASKAVVRALSIEARLCRWLLVSQDVMTFGCYRDKNGDISRKYGNLLICRLRQYYGLVFRKDNERLSDVLHKLEEGSLSELVKDDEAGRLEQVSPLTRKRS